MRLSPVYLSICLKFPIVIFKSMVSNLKHMFWALLVVKPCMLTSYARHECPPSLPRFEDGKTD